jgi:hypothetical protein
MGAVNLEPIRKVKTTEIQRFLNTLCVLCASVANIIKRHRDTENFFQHILHLFLTRNAISNTIAAYSNPGDFGISAETGVDVATVSAVF